MEYNVPNIHNDINFWFLRTDGGLFYDLYIQERFVAYGYNFFNKDKIGKIANEDVGEEFLKREIRSNLTSNYFVKPQGAGKIASEILNFTKKMKPGDIVLIPSRNSNEIAFLELEQYYEEEREIEFITDKITIKRKIPDINPIDERNIREEIDRIKTHNDIAVDCPYLKRWKVKLLSRMKYSEINNSLIKLMSTPSSIQELNEYPIQVLGCIYPVFSYQNNINISMFIKSASNNAMPLNILNNRIMDYAEYNKLDTYSANQRINVNSPGYNIFSFTLSGKINEFLKGILKGVFKKEADTIIVERPLEERIEKVKKIHRERNEEKLTEEDKQKIENFINDYEQKYNIKIEIGYNDASSIIEDLKEVSDRLKIKKIS